MSRLALSVCPLLAGLMFVAAPAHAAAGGPLGTLMTGRYDCERPGAPGAASALPEPAASFTVVTSSRYLADGMVAGAYLMRGDTVTMTTGPLAGTRLLRVRSKFLRRVEADGGPGPLRCVLARHSDLR